MSNKTKVISAAALATTLLVTACLALPFSLQPAQAAPPLVVTETPRPAMTPTPLAPPPQATAVPTSAPTVEPTAGSTQPAPTSAPNSVNTYADPYVRMSGCSECAKTGELIVFDVLVGNRGTASAVNVQMRHYLAPFLEFVDVVTTHGGVVSTGQQTIVDIGSLVPGEVVSIRVTARAIAQAENDNFTVARVFTTGGGDEIQNNLAGVSCNTCKIVLPTTGSDLATPLEMVCKSDWGKSMHRRLACPDRKCGHHRSDYSVGHAVAT